MTAPGSQRRSGNPHSETRHLIAGHRLAQWRGFGEAGSPTLGAELMSPIQLSDDQLAIVIASAEPLEAAVRGQYLERVAELLTDIEIGDGAVSRAARRAQAELLRPPTRGPMPSKWSRRG